MNSQKNRHDTQRAYRDRSNTNGKPKYNNAYYNHTSEAFDYNSNIDYNYTPKYSPNVDTRTNRPFKKIKKTKYVSAEKNEKTLSLRFLISFALIMTFTTCIVMLEAKIIEQRFKMDELNASLGEITEYNRYLEIELSRNLDLDYIENVAINKLGMQRPASHQIVYITVPKESYSETRIINSENIFEKLFD